MSFSSSEQTHVNPYAYDQIVANAEVDQRVAFIRRTYTHLAGAILAFVLLESLIFTLFADQLPKMMGLLQQNQYSWLIVLVAFIGVSWIAERWARSNTSQGMQYLGLSLYVVAEAIIFLPLLYMANTFYPGSISSAAIVTAIVFGGLTLTVFVTKADFSFLRMALTIGAFAAVGLIVARFFIPQLSLGFWFSGLMVVLASGYILYHTSNIMHHYRTTQHVAAALALFASVALLFWYILQLFMSRD